MSSKYLFEKVRELKLPTGGYALFGSASMAVRGLKESGDIDIIVEENLWDELSRKKEWSKKISNLGSKYLFNDKIELYKDWHPGNWNINELIKSAEIIDGLPFIKLEDVIKWKKLYARGKDFKDIEIIENFLRMQE